MSTRSVIARTVNPDEKEQIWFEGRYHHWDGYPSGLGAMLWELYHGHFNRDIKAMMKVLIDDHPAGWSTICNKDFNFEPGYVEYDSENPDDDTRPVCFCHGSRSEDSHLHTNETASGSGCEYAYVIDEDSHTMLICSSYCESGGKMIGMFGSGDDDATWITIESVDFNGSEPVWDKVDQPAAV